MALGNMFLRGSELGISDLADAVMDGQVLVQLEEAMGSEHRMRTESLMKDITEALRPIFIALPKNNMSRVGPASARFALHRLFVQRHGWQVKGLAAYGETWEGGHPSVALADKVPHKVKHVFDAKLGSAGLSLNELATFAATLEQMIHSEAMARLQAAYKLSSHEPMQTLPQGKARYVIQTYMAIYLTGLNVSATRRYRNPIANIEHKYPGWNDTLKFLDNLQLEAVGNRPDYEFSDITDVVEVAGERFGRFQNRECIDMKKTLVKHEETEGSGRVRLGDFYRSALHAGQWQFTESEGYLRELGALDESESSNLRVIIPNYLNAPSNCIEPSAYYGVCCIDECEELLGHVERALEESTATPQEIAKIFVNLPSASLAAGRKLSSGLMRRLEELGNHHNGRIPVHGRLFAQWLHLAYPRECPYPHISGTIQPKRVQEWQKAGKPIAARKEEMQQHIEAGRQMISTRNGTDEEFGSAWWSMAEELVDAQGHSWETARRAEQGRWRITMYALFACTAGTALMLSHVKVLDTIFKAPELISTKSFSRW
eukprot:CAMPEP_0172786252 /NCGR_PEP_ID=MMETSP1074-20121228/205856_1 /TAXON_ID=2916 /ORGANISM="Ceratium fusus, Strain PA161109" /LENGTH=543 /DNA_ID=CAMNT_0013623265 /DNA_START=70 /DNA_END=1698 /DNA_ORIENTATION=-